MIRAQIIDKWQTNGLNKPYLNQFIDDNGLANDSISITDVTGQEGVPQEPNSVAVEIIADTETFAAIEADTVNFYVIWSENA